MKKVDSIDIVYSSNKGSITIFPENIDYLDINGIGDRIITVEKNQIEKITMADEIVMVLKNISKTIFDSMMVKFSECLNIHYNDGSCEEIFVYNDGSDEYVNHAQESIIGKNGMLLLIISKSLADGTKTIRDYVKK